MSSKILTREEVIQERLQTMARVFERADRTITGMEVFCEVTKNDGSSVYRLPPAWSDGKTITFNAHAIGDVSSVEDIIALNGLNYHEVSHILYTPRQASRLVSRLQQYGLFRMFNILEDQRIESMFAAEFPSTRAYFTMTITKYIMNDSRLWSQAFPLLWGRRYLGLELRERFANIFKDQSIVSQAKAIIDEFRTLVYPRDYNRAFDLTQEFASLINGMDLDKADPYKHDDTRCQSSGSPAPASEQNNVQDWREVADEEQAEDDGEAVEDVDGEAEGSGEGGEGEESEEDASESGTGDADSGEGDGEGEGSSTGEDDRAEGGEEGGSGGSGAGTNEGSLEDRKALRDLMEKTYQENRDSADVQQDAREKQKIITSGDGDNTIDGKILPGYERLPEAMDSLIAKKAGNEFRRLAMDLDPGFHTHKSSGRINMRRAMHSDDLDTIFDQWSEGKADATSIEYVIAVDVSGSMAGRSFEASTALWQIKRAVESLGNDVNVTVLAFNYTSFMIYKSGERAKHDEMKVFQASGGTDPIGSIQTARKVFYRSRKHHKILTIITDGVWSNSYRADDYIKNLNNAGVITSILYLNDPALRNMTTEEAEEAARHESQIFHVSNNPSDILTFAKKVVKEAMKK